MTSEELQCRLGELAHELNAYRKDAELYERMKKAQSETARIQKEMTVLTAALSKAMDAEDKADRQARRDSIKELSVAVADRSYTITYLQRVFDGETNTHVWQNRIVQGFQALEPRVMGYLLDEAPQILPRQIADLVPGDPYGAMDKYLSNLRRGISGL